MDKQLIFDDAVSGIRKQGKRAIAHGGCVYRASDGCKCAVGHLIPNDKYYSELENYLGYSSEVLQTIDGKYGVTHKQDDGIFLRELQMCHDGGVFEFSDTENILNNLLELNEKTPIEQEEIVEKAFEAFARKYKLRYTKEPWNHANVSPVS